MNAIAPMGLVKKLAEVMLAVERVPKRGRNSFHGYDYATEADIVAVVRKELAERHVMLLPQVDNHERHELRDGVDKNGNAKPRDPLTVLHMRFTFVDGESGERLELPWLGVGQDGGDKGVYKAMTGGEKYVLMKTFLMPTGDDPEEVAERKEDKQRTWDADKDAKRQQKDDAARVAAKQASVPIVDKGQQTQIVDAAKSAGWMADDVKRLLAFHGFKKSADVTVDKLPVILDALKNGATVPPVAGELAPENAAVL